MELSGDGGLWRQGSGGDLSFLCDSNVQPRLRRAFHETMMCRGHMRGGPREEPERPEFESQLCHWVAVQTLMTFMPSFNCQLKCYTLMDNLSGPTNQIRSPFNKLLNP